MNMLGGIPGATSKNFVFIGEAGSGKSEIAVNFARELCKNSGKKVHFFDMDMTKPLFRSRDIQADLEAVGIVVHYEKQFMDAPTLVGGVRRLLRDSHAYVVMDVGGDYIGARAIGGYAQEINHTDSQVWYVINAYRPWSYDIDHIDRILGEILGVSHIQMEKLKLISNPNLGLDTTLLDVLTGHQKTVDLVSPYQNIDFLCVREQLYKKVKEQVQIPVMPIHLYLTYPWLKAQAAK